MDNNEQEEFVYLKQKYSESEHKSRSLNNVQFKDIEALKESILGPVKPLNDKDYDMTHQIMLDFDKGRLNTKFNINDIQKIKSDTINREFNILEAMYADEVIESQRDYDERMHGNRDRYSDIFTYFKSQVRLKEGVQESKNPYSGYINACYLNSPFTLENNSKYGDGKIIASQGPLPQTTDHFWQMIIEQNVTMIVSTCRTVEQNKQKCNQFWPSSVDKFSTFKITQSDVQPINIQVNLIEEKRENQYLERREMSAIKPDGSVQNVTQIHFQGWPDHGIPEGQAVKDFEMMLNYFIEWNLKSKDDEKAIVHCSAGIGRTGTTITLMDIIIKLHAFKNAGIQNPEISVFNTVRKLREHRYSAVQTASQYVFIYKMLSKWISNKLI